MHGRTIHLSLITRSVIILSTLWLNISTAREPWPVDFLDDADLHDIHFIDSEQGWAVGDRGTILHTVDSGTTWNIQPTPIGDSLHGIHFIDAQNGWAVGGSAVPYTQRGRGVVLRTDNGGRTWLVEKVRTLPALRDVRFFDKKQGVAIGDASTLYPAGAFSTRDGGRTWNPYPVRTAHGWTAADFRPTGRGLLLAAAGHITTCDGGNCRARPTPRMRTGKMRDIAWIDEERAIAVGDGGAVWLSRDGGTRWSDASQNIAATDAAAAKFDFLTVATDGTSLWVAGAAGSSQSRLYRSADGGQSWQAVPIQHALPISKLTFDEVSGRGWAVGPLGGVLQSSSHGRSWQTVLGGDRRLFALAAFDSSQQVPWRLLAQVAGGYGGRMRVIVANSDAPTTLSMAASERLHQAALAVGASNAESIRTSDPASVINKSIGDWNPTLVILGGSDSFVEQATAAVGSTDAPISVWRAEMGSAVQSGSTVSVIDSEIAQSLGASLAQLDMEARSIVGQGNDNEERVLACTPLSGHAATGGKITSGFSFRPGSPPRRVVTLNEDRRDLEQVAQQYTVLQQLIRRAVEEPDRGAAWLAQAENMTSRLSSAAAAKVLYELARKQLATGNVPSALATLDAIATRHVTSDIHDVALRDGVLWSASREAAHLGRAAATRLVNQNDSNVRPATFKFDPAATPQMQEPVRRGEAIPAERLFNTGQTIADQMEFAATTAQQLLAEQNAFRKSGGKKIGPVRAAAHTSAISSPPTKLGTWLERVGPEHLADPDLQLAIESHRRRFMKPGARQEAVFQRLARTLPGTWRDCANAELALIKPERDSIKPVVAGRFGTRPRLDGMLTIEEATWPDFATADSAKHPAIVVPLRPVDAADTTVPSPAGVAILASDKEFLYIAIRCQQLPESDYSFVDAPRTRDTDLAHHDRVSILIDTDRDYSLTWRLTVDHRGWTGESLDTNSAWNPRWFVAASKPDTAQNGEWICEAAIAWSELDEVLPTMDNPWALKVVRTLPDGRKQFWPASSGQTQHLEDAGLFYFGE